MCVYNGAFETVIMIFQIRKITDKENSRIGSTGVSFWRSSESLNDKFSAGEKVEDQTAENLLMERVGFM